MTLEQERIEALCVLLGVDTTTLKALLKEWQTTQKAAGGDGTAREQFGVALKETAPREPATLGEFIDGCWFRQREAVMLVNMAGLDTVMAAPERVWAEVDTALLAARDRHQDALERAQADARAAQQRLDEHQAQMPDDPAVIPGWVRQKAERAAELEAYQGVVTRATERLQQAQQAVATAYREAWFALHAAALEAVIGGKR